MSGTSTALETYELSFKQDLNGDGVIGIPAATAATLSSTSANPVASNFAFNFDSGRPNPQLTHSDALVAVEQLGGLTGIPSALALLGTISHQEVTGDVAHNPMDLHLLDLASSHFIIH